MKESLSQLTMADYIELLCGNDSVLLSESEKTTSQQILTAKRNIIFEYKTIADHSSIVAYLSEQESKKKTAIEILLFQLCNNLIKLNAFDEVREILIDYGINANSMSEDKLKIAVTSRLNRALSLQKRESLQENEIVKKQSPKEIRAIFDKQTACVMTYFKFQIDINSISATIFANIVNQYNREIQAKMAAIKK